MKSKEFMNNLNGKSLAELNDELVAAKKELFNLRFQNATNQLDNTSRIKEVRKNIARIQTAMSMEQKAANKKVQERRTLLWRENLEKLVSEKL